MGNPTGSQPPAPVTVVQQQGQPEPASAPGQQSSLPSEAIPQVIDQAVQFGEMRAQFNQTQSELAQTRASVADLQRDREADREEIRELREGNQRLLQIAEQAAAEEAEEAQQQQATQITPPAPETPPAPADQPARQKQSRFKTFLFGNEDE